MINEKRVIVTILMITRNRCKLIPRAIDSALNQTFKEFELIIIDGDSEDETRQVVLEYTAKDSRVKLVEYKNAPPHHCFNHGIDLAKGEYIAVLDDDDEFYPTKLEKQLRVMESGGEELGLVYCWEEYWDDKLNKQIGELKNTDRGDVYKVLLASPIGAGGGTQMLIRKNALKKVGGYDISIDIPSDMQLRLNLAQYYKFDYVAEILIRTHVNHIYQRLTGSLKHRGMIELHKKMLSDHSIAYEIFPEKQIWQLKEIVRFAITDKDLRLTFNTLYQLAVLKIRLRLKLHVLFDIFLEITKRLVRQIFK